MSSEYRRARTHCHVDCGGACALEFVMRGDTIVRVETDATPGDFQARACVRGRAIDQWLDAPDRVNWPLRRVPGTKRGEGAYERISWDEALDLYAREFTRIRAAHGNEAIFVQQCSSPSQSAIRHLPLIRLFNLAGGCLLSYGNYSNMGLFKGGLRYTYGGNWAVRSFRSLQEGQLVVLFGNAVADTRMAGDGSVKDLIDAIVEKHVKVICIDPRMSRLCANGRAEWVPVNPGTDAALVAGIAHELLAAGLADRRFLDAYCAGFSEATLPEGAALGSSYEAYIAGEGPDGIEKTPAWAASITGVPTEKIVELAHRIGEAKPCYIGQGYGPQRRVNGEAAARSVLLLAQMVGQVGAPGTNNGSREAASPIEMPGMPVGNDPVRVSFPAFSWVQAIEDGPALDRLHNGVRNADRLPASVKMMVSYGNDLMASQHGDLNHTAHILRDESLCEFIVCHEVVMTPSARYADLILPDLAPQETHSLTATGENCRSCGLVFGSPIRRPQFERRDLYDVCTDLARRLGVEEAFTEGRTRRDWLEYVYREFCDEMAGAPGFEQMPTYDEGERIGFWKTATPAEAASEDFLDDPAAHPLPTRTGKIQVHAPEIAERIQENPALASTVSPLPIYIQEYGERDDAAPGTFDVFAFHTSARTHSTFGNVPVLRDVAPDALWINAEDARARGIGEGDMVRVVNERGSVVIPAHPTALICRGSVAMQEGAWPDLAVDRDGRGTINDLTSFAEAPLSHGNAQHSARARVELVAHAALNAASPAPTGGRGSRAVVCEPVRCTGCAACTVACADAHHCAADEARIKVVARESTRAGEPGLALVAVARPGCDRCASVVPAAAGPLCVAACPTRALRVPSMERR